jgi:hypothetical protein
MSRSKLLRRAFLAGAGAGLSALAFARARAGTGSASSSLGAATTGTRAAARNLVLVVARGGWDVPYARDPKPGLSTVDAPAGQITDFSGLPIFTHESRPAVSEFFTAHAQRTALVRGVSVRSVSHLGCAARMLTGTPSETSPDLGALVAAELGQDYAVPYLVLGRTSFTGPYAALATRAGTTNQLSALLDDGSVVWLASEPPPWRPSAGQSDMIRKYVQHRAGALRDRHEQLAGSRGRIDDFLASIDRGQQLKSGGALGTLNFNRELGPQSEVAVAALEQGLCRAVQLEFSDFDTHTNNGAQGQLHDDFFAGLKTLVDQLAARPGTQGGTLLEETVVAVVSEMSRTPRLNGEGGKDHWPVTSALVLGAGVAGGRVLGGTTDELGARKVDLKTGEIMSDGVSLDYGSFNAGVLALCGVDPSSHLNAEPLGALGA